MRTTRLGTRVAVALVFGAVGVVGLARSAAAEPTRAAIGKQDYRPSTHYWLEFFVRSALR